jgi:hypothetical protein
MPSQADYPGGPNGGPLMPPQMDGGRNGRYTFFFNKDLRKSQF